MGGVIFHLSSVLRIFFRLTTLPKHIALVHDWLVSMRGGEKVLEVLCELFPDATLFTLVHKNGSVSSTIERMHIKTSFLQNMPFGKSHYQYYLPLYPTAVQQFDLSDFDVVISSSHAVAKGVRVRKDALHICYCYTPMRYIWDLYDDYFGHGRANVLTRTAMKFSLSYLRKWDIETSKGVDHFIAISAHVKERIKRIYQRDAEVIYPPVDVHRFSLPALPLRQAGVSPNDNGYYLIVSALVPYKRIDLAIEAFNQLGEKLVIIGEGSEEKQLKSRARQNIEFLGWVNDDELRKYYSECRALIFPGEEDFGIVPVEAMACGKPVVAYAKGGTMETVINGTTGLFFHEQTAGSLQQAIQKFQQMIFDPVVIRNQTLQFERNRFKASVEQYIMGKWLKHLS
ncbi:MAG: glycosyltransferase [Ignavibacteriae bacterium]|nr:glycosyltransferase [Ignavibacteriota bacterium]